MDISWNGTMFKILTKTLSVNLKTAPCYTCTRMWQGYILMTHDSLIVKQLTTLGKDLSEGNFLYRIHNFPLCTTVVKGSCQAIW